MVLPLNTSVTNFTLEEAGPADTIRYTGGTIMLIATLLGLFGNILIPIAIVHEFKEKNDNKRITNIFIVSLCINDSLNLIINNGIVITSYFLQTPLPLFLCVITAHATSILMGSSLWHGGLLAIHRLLVVVFTSLYTKLSKKIYLCSVLVIAHIVPLLFLIQPIFVGSMVEYHPKVLRCIIRKEYSFYLASFMVLLIALPSITLLSCYIYIFIQVHRSAFALLDTSKKEWLQWEIRITKMFVIIFLLIMFGYLPYSIVRNVDKDLLLSANFYSFLTVFFALANCGNPLIYGVMDKKILRACIKIIRPKKRPKPQVSTTKEQEAKGNVDAVGETSSQIYPYSL